MSSAPASGAQSGEGLLHLIRARREIVNGSDAGIRLVYRSEFVQSGRAFSLEKYLADKAPFFYRNLDSVISDFRSGLFLSAIKSTLARLPKSESFRESHFGEIVAGVFAEDVMKLRRLYSKLTLLTAENSNAYKMDLVLYDPAKDPVEIVFGEVKCSPKCAADGMPPKHDGSCYADIFNSMNNYEDKDKDFDLTAARDQMSNAPVGDHDRLRSALKPYSGAPMRYAAFAVIDTSTYLETEAQVLRKRKNSKTFEVDIVCLETFAPVADAVFKALEQILSPQ